MSLKSKKINKMVDKKKCVVAFDTSNYTTSIAVCDIEGHIVANLKAPLSVKSGERGLRQADAVFAHTKNLPLLCRTLADILECYDPIAVGVSKTPRNAEESYMPCFLCGIAAAEAFAASRALPIYTTSHQDGHVMAALYSCGFSEQLQKDRFLAFHVSGGTTEALLVTPNRSGSTEMDIQLVAQTRDINAGQAIDRVGVMMGLDFPCGPVLEKLALECKVKVEQKRVSVEDGCCNLSGIENMAQKIYSSTEDPCATAAFVFDFIGRTLREMTLQLFSKYGKMPVLYAGGVMSNKIMRKTLCGAAEAYFAEPEFSADNAAGVALIALKKAILDISEDIK